MTTIDLNESLENSIRFITNELPLSQSALSLGLTKIDFKTPMPPEMVDCVNLINRLLSESRDFSDLKREALEELNLLEKENKGLHKAVNELNEKNSFLEKKSSSMESEIILTKKQHKKEIEKMDEKVENMKREVKTYKGREKGYKNRIRKNETEFRKLQSRLASKLEQINPPRFRFCLNSEKVINEFRLKTQSENKNELHKLTVRRLEEQLSITKIELNGMKNSLFSFKNSLAGFVSSFNDELDSLDIEENCLMLDFSEGNDDLPLDAYKDLLDEGIKAGLQFLKEKIKKCGKSFKNGLIENKENIEQQIVQETTANTKQTVEMNDKLTEHLEIISKQQNIIESGKENNLRHEKAKQEIFKRIENHFKSSSTSLAEKKALAEKVAREELRIKRERKDLEAEKKFWFEKFEKSKRVKLSDNESEKVIKTENKLAED